MQITDLNSRDSSDYGPGAILLSVAPHDPFAMFECEMYRHHDDRTH